jgi:hypothetical protein
MGSVGLMVGSVVQVGSTRAVCQYHAVGTGPEADLPRGIGAPATRALVSAGYTSLDALAAVRAADLAKLHGVGPRALKVLQEELEKQGRSLG